MKELKAFFAFLTSLNPFSGGEPRDPVVPFVYFVETAAEVKVLDKEEASSYHARAEALALKAAVRKVLVAQSEGASKENLDRFEGPYIKNYRSYIDSYTVNRKALEGDTYSVFLSVNVLSGKLREAGLEEGLWTPGKHLEFEVLAAPISGKVTERDDLGGSLFVDEKAWSSLLYGLGLRWYITDGFFFSSSALFLPSSVEMATLTDTTGATFPVTLKQFTPVNHILGFKLYDRKRVRFTAGLGPTLLRIRASVPDGAPVSPIPESQWVFGWTVRAEAQYVPLARLGAGLRIDFNTKNKYSVLGGKAASDLIIAGQVLFAF